MEKRAVMLRGVPEKNGAGENKGAHVERINGHRADIQELADRGKGRTALQAPPVCVFWADSLGNTATG